MQASQIPVELYFSARRLKNLDYFSKSDPFLKLYLQKTYLSPLECIGRTETISNNVNPDWKQSIKADFFFEIRQIVAIEVLDDDGSENYQRIGKVETCLGAIMGGNNQSLVLTLLDEKLKDVGEVAIKAQCTLNSSYIFIEALRMKWKGGNIANMDSYFDCWDKSDPYIKFLKLRPDNTFVEVAKTQIIRDNQNPSWKYIDVPLSRLFDKNAMIPEFKVQCWDEQKLLQNHKLIGSANIKLQQLKNFKEPLNIELYNPQIKKPGLLTLQDCAFVIPTSFIDYLKSGLQLSLSIAIDFTGSNGHPSQVGSLHYIGGHQLNHYQMVIQAVWSIIQNYDYDKSIPAYGFGAKLKFPKMQDNTANHCFPLSGDKNQTQIRGFEQFRQAYMAALSHIELAGPTYFTPILRQAYKNASMLKNNFAYQILLILTDGQIHDMQQTVNIIVQNSRLPLSIIIVGLGNDEFKEMKRLDGDQGGGLRDSTGKLCERDVVQFVPFSQYNNNVNMLTQQLLKEIPSQVCQYMRLIGKEPVKLPPVNIQNLFQKKV